MIPPDQNGQFVACMEKVLDIYKRQYDANFPVICMDESPKQLIRETRQPLSTRCGSIERYDYEYERCGICNIFMANEPLTGNRIVEIYERKTKIEWAYFIEKILQYYESATKIILVMDNLSTHKAGSFYDAFPPEKAKSIYERFEFVYTPKHGSWLNMAEIELNVLHKQCLNRRIDCIDTVRDEVVAWQNHRNTQNATINWQFTTEDARIKLKRLYPTLQS